jgi:hypothetical protein
MAETGVASEELKIFSETGLGKESAWLFSNKLIGDARGPVFIKCGARGERGEMLPPLDGNKAWSLWLHRTGFAEWRTRILLLIGAGGGTDVLEGMSFSTGVMGVSTWPSSCARFIKAAVLKAGGTSCSVEGGGRWMVLWIPRRLERLGSFDEIVLVLWEMTEWLISIVGVAAVSPACPWSAELVQEEPADVV